MSFAERLSRRSQDVRTERAARDEAKITDWVEKVVPRFEKWCKQASADGRTSADNFQAERLKDLPELEQLRSPQCFCRALRRALSPHGFSGLQVYIADLSSGTCIIVDASWHLVPAAEHERTRTPTPTSKATSSTATGGDAPLFQRFAGQLGLVCAKSRVESPRIMVPDAWNRGFVSF